MNGSIRENYTVTEILKSYLNAGEEPNLFYYRDNDAKEIDIVMEADGELHPMEIKKTANPGTGLLTRPFDFCWIKARSNVEREQSFA